MQLVQAALSSAEAGLATRAANTIGRCLALETGQERWRTRLAENHLNLSREMLLEMQSWRDDELRLCQALDDFSRAQWLPLLRRGLAERRIGDANDLLLTHRDHPQQRLLESEVYPSLRNDAFRCHEFSLSTLYFDHLALEHALSVDERLAVWQVLKDQYEAKPDKFFYDLLRTRPPPDQGSDPAEVQRIVMTIRSHC